MPENVVKPIDVAALWDTTTITDRVAGDITILTPITVDGDLDHSRLPIFTGNTQLVLQTPQGSSLMPLQIELPGPTLRDAIAGWSAAVQKAIDDFESNLVRQRLLNGVESRSRKQ